MSTPDHPQQYLDQLEERIGADPLLPYALVVESASKHVDNALDPASTPSRSLEDVIKQAKADIRSLSGR